MHLKHRPLRHEMSDVVEIIGVGMALLVALEIDQQRIVERLAPALDKACLGQGGGDFGEP